MSVDISKAHQLGEEWRKEVVAWMQKDLARKGVETTGQLISSVVSTIQKTSDGFVVQVFTKDYGGILNSLSYRKRFKSRSKIRSKPVNYRTISRARVKSERALFAKLLDLYDTEMNDAVFLHLNV